MLFLKVSFALVFSGMAFSQDSALSTHLVSSPQQVALNCGELNWLQMNGERKKNYKFDSKDICKNVILLLKLADESCPITIRTSANRVDSAELSCDVDEQRAKKGVMGL